MSYANLASALTSVATSIVNIIVGFITGIANFISQNIDLFVAAVGIGAVVTVILGVTGKLPFIGNILSTLGSALGF